MNQPTPQKKRTFSKRQVPKRLSTEETFLSEIRKLTFLSLSTH